ncbi:alkaline phosphatase family protein [Mucilaginibacter sp. SG564]|uniref:alkaline phosphatase family protein n=1 Tax=Mucilaginibacter sp. SG564 TaxID=2587022 RepID=UPI001551F9E9|nr:alkaline phosphatase family protein [Mucilaginibacter sp. SG564]NOW94961.1 putative AlkP superfamily pyrophosphatase or phosphodiesterase [Mucilaginibacter sp. SG564]
MKKTLLILCSALTLSAHAQKVKKAVYIIADGIPADVIEKLDLPNLKNVIKDGKYLRIHVGGDKGTYNETPTISAVGYNSLLTGTWLNKHNVPDNDIKDPNYNYQTIFRLFKEQYPAKKIGVYSSWTDNRTKLIGEGLKQTGNLKMDYKADGFELDTVHFKHKGDYMHRIDEEVVAQASNSIKTVAPDLSWIYLEYTDDMGHAHGDSPEFYDAVKMMDAQVGKVYEAINYRKKKFNEDWLLIITTDHGRSEANGRGHGGQSDRQRNTWLVTNYPNLNQYANVADPGIVDIMPTLARFMNVKLTGDAGREVDGTPLIGAVSVSDVKLNYFQNSIDVSWKASDTKGNVKVYVTPTNNFKTGGVDNYKLMGEYPIAQRHALLNVKDLPSDFYKVVLEAPDNTTNKWVVITPKK